MWKWVIIIVEVLRSALRERSELLAENRVVYKNSDRADSRGAEGVLTRDNLRIVMEEDARSGCNRLMNPMRFIVSV